MWILHFDKKSELFELQYLKLPEQSINWQLCVKSCVLCFPPNNIHLPHQDIDLYYGGCPLQSICIPWNILHTTKNHKVHWNLQYLKHHKQIWLWSACLIWSACLCLQQTEPEKSSDKSFSCFNCKMHTCGHIQLATSTLNTSTFEPMPVSCFLSWPSEPSMYWVRGADGRRAPRSKDPSQQEQQQLLQQVHLLEKVAARVGRRPRMKGVPTMGRTVSQ